MEIDKELKYLLTLKQEELNDWYESYEAMKKWVLPALIAVMISCFLNAHSFNYFYSYHGFDYKMTKITFLATIYGVFLCAYTIGFLFDIDRGSIEASFFRIEKYRLRVIRYGILILTFAAFAVNISGQTKALAIAMLTTLAIFTFALVMVTLNPKALFWPFLTNIGSVSIELFVIIHFLFFLSKWFDVTVLLKIVLFLYIIYTLFISLPRVKTRLNPVQGYALKLVDNKDLAELYKNKRQKLDDQIKAQKVIDSISGDEMYGVRLVVESDLKEMNNSNKAYLNLYKVCRGLVIVFMFFFDPIKEGLIQYLTIEKIIDYVCANFKIWCR